MTTYKKIVITGPESSGKSTLCRQLAACFELPYVAEYARIYLENSGPDYDRKILDKIAARQMRSISSASHIYPRNFVDTSAVVLIVWYEIRFKEVPTWLISSLEDEKDAYYLLCAPDIPWQEDVLRENPTDRHLLFERYKYWLEKCQKPFSEVSGLAQSRFENAKKIVHSLWK